MILVSDRWKIPVIGSPMYILQIKLKNLKKVLIKWNKEVFGDIVTNAHIANTEHALTIQDQFWMEKSRVQKFKDGDRNISYFHRIARIKASYKVIHMLRHIDQYFNTP
ncbi:hypothetical protein MTR_1g037300 [Medicago truncatula]|uniref:Uncharacterized protein n=1 Tax=Medicago truncatula TaxID=3880 RepID=A0A072VFY1_MEDTR|nr:hypothetical protein MTR_1g037300 [Medicago truncatula]